MTSDHDNNQGEPHVLIASLNNWQVSEALTRFEGGDNIDLSVFVSEFSRGGGPPLHTHPYPEIFIVESGTVIFTVEDEIIEVEAGNLVVVPANRRHKFEGGSTEMRMISIHPSGAVSQDNLE